MMNSLPPTTGRTGWRRWTLALTLTLLLPGWRVAAQTLTQSNFVGVIVPQFMTGPTSRLPVPFRATVSGLTPSTLYRYYTQAETQAVINTAPSNIGAGNPLIVPPTTAGTYFYTSAPNLNGAVGNYGTFTTDGTGSFTGWFAIVNTANAARFTAGTTIFPTIALAKDATPAVTEKRYALDASSGIKVLGLTAGAGANNGTGIQSPSSATPKNLVFLYDNVAGTGRPLSGGVVESIGVAIATTPAFYSTANGTWNSIIPNNNNNGVRYIEQRALSNGAIVGCASDADGLWSTTNTANPTGGTTALVISNTDAPLTSCGAPSNPVPVTTSLSPNTRVAGGGGFTLTVTGSSFVSGAVVRWNGSDRPTTFVNSTTVTATITDADVAYVGSRNVTVVNPVPGGGSSTPALPFSVTAPGASTITVIYAGGSETTPLLIAYSGTVNTFSAPQNYQVAGASLDDDLTVSAPTGFQVSLSSGSGYSSAVSIDQAVAEAGLTTVYVRFAPLTAGSTGTVNVSNTDGTSTTNVPVSGFALATQPTNGSTTVTITNVTTNAFKINFAGGTGQKHLVTVRQGGSVNFVPVDGTGYPANAVFGAGTGLGAGLDNYVVYNSTGNSVVVTGLLPGTQYFVAVNDFNDAGIVGPPSAANYLTGAGNFGSGSQTTQIGPPQTYTWNVPSGNWSAAGSWTPARTLPQVNDILVFNGAVQATPAATLDFATGTNYATPSSVGQTIGQLRFINGVNATLSSNAARQLTLDGGLPGVDLKVDAGSQVSVMHTLVNSGLFLIVTQGETAEVRGTVTFDGLVAQGTGVTKLASNGGTVSPSAGPIRVKSGGQIVAGRNFSGNAFGGETGTPATYQNGVVFEAGSTYRQLGGSNPFGFGSPNSAVYFAPSSIYSYGQWNATPSGSGRAYAHFVIDIDLTGAPMGTTAAPSLSGGSPFTVQDLRVLNAQSVTISTTPLTISGNMVINVPTTISAPDITLAGGAATHTLTGSALLSVSGGSTALRVNSPYDMRTGKIVLSGSSTRSITGTGSLMFGDVTYSATAQTTLAIPASLQRMLTISGTGSLASNGNLTLLSDRLNGTAMVVNSSTGAVTGATTVQRYIRQDFNYGIGYRHLSSPVQATTFADLTTLGFTPRVDGNFNTPQEPVYTAQTQPNVFGYDEARGGASDTSFYTGWFSPSSLADGMTRGRGWSVSMTSRLTPDFVGVLNNGTVGVAGVTQTGTNMTNTQKSGWNLLGNPYPGPIDWDLVTVPAGMSSAISVWKSTGAGPAQGTFTTYTNGVGPVGADLIALGQGFFARATGGNGTNLTFNFTNACRLTAYQDVALYRPGLPVSVDTRPIVALGLRASTASADAADETFVYFQAGATPGVDDRFDGSKPFHSTGMPTLVSLTAEGQELGVNGLAPEAMTAGTRVPLLVDLPTAGSYSFDVTRFANLTAAPVYLRDLKLGTRLPLSAQSSYTFTGQPGVDATRFALEFGVSRTAQRVTGLSADATANVLVFPNPSQGQFQIAVPADLTVNRATVTDALGRTVAAPALPSGATTALSLQLPVGVYTLRLETTAGSLTRRLVIE